MSDDHLATVQPAEVLSVSTARAEGKLVVILATRLDTERFEHVNLALTPRQARRLLDDLAEQFQSSEPLKSVRFPRSDAKQVLHRIMADQPVPTPANE